MTITFLAWLMKRVEKEIGKESEVPLIEVVRKINSMSNLILLSHFEIYQTTEGSL